MLDFVHLHMHSEYSLLDGVTKIKELPKVIKEMGMQAVALTDHGNMFGAVKFFKECKKVGIKPIIGCEMYIAPRRMQDREYGIDNKRYHLTLLAKNEVGYKNLVKMVSIANTEGMYYKPRIDKETLKKYNEGLVCLSGCLGGEFGVKSQESYEKAKAVAIEFKEIFKDDYYLEIQDNTISEQKILNQMAIKLSKELGIELVATNDCHYIKREDKINQDILIAIQTGKKLSDPNRMSIKTDDFFIKTKEEMIEAFKNIPSAIQNTVVIAEKCNFEFEFGNTKLPNYELPNEISHEEYLKNLCEIGLKKRYDKSKQEAKYVRERLNFELETIIKMGFTDYFLIVWDLIKYAKDNKIPVGPGRGSGAGSLVAYLLYITEIDPLKYGLIFERFLNPERISMPDFDIDFCNERREEVLRYVENKYGKDHVAEIITFGTMSARMVIRDVGRVLDIPYNKVNKLAKYIPKVLKVKIEDVLKTDKDFNKLYNTDEEVKNIIDYSMKLEGMPRNTSTHACGVVITDKPVSNYVPLYNNDGKLVTQYTMTNLEELGLLKMDFLGLRTLTVISECKKIVKKTRNIDVVVDTNNVDKEVFKLWEKGDTEGIFQFEAEGMKKFMKELKPDSIEDLIAGLSLYRPGPMDQIPKYILGKQNEKNITYLHEKLKPILEKTYGCMVYQEQVMQIVKDLAGYPLSRADLVRRAMGKKQADVMNKEREIFVNGLTEDTNIIIQGCKRNGINNIVANEIFDEMAKFAEFAFNKSHAAAYAIVAYETAYLKKYYTEEFLAATMNSYLGNLDKIPIYIKDAKNNGILVLPPDINESFIKFAVIAEKKMIRFGIGNIKNVGITAADNIIKERKLNGKYTSFTNFIERTIKYGINKKAIESLIKAGACDNLGQTRATLLASYEDIIDRLNKPNNEIKGQISIFDFFKETENKETNQELYTYVEELKPIEKLMYEKEMLGIYISGHPLEGVYKYLKNAINFNYLDYKNIKRSENLKIWKNNLITSAGIIQKITKKTTKNNNVMVILEIEDLYGQFEVVCFDNVYARFKEIIQEGKLIGIKGRINGITDGNVSIVIENITKIVINKKKSD